MVNASKRFADNNINPSSTKNMLLKVYNSDYITKSIQMGSPYDPPENVNGVGKYYETRAIEKKINQK